jgi:hypothetical protein
MADYPDWVMKHKQKGTYINHVNGKYYLYAAHSERVPGTKKVRRVSDGYIGRITEKDGLIQARDKVSGEVSVYEYGVCAATLHLCRKALGALRREFRGGAGFVTAAGLLFAIHGVYNDELFRHAYLSVLYPNANLGREPTEKQKTGIERVARMAKDAWQREFGGEAQATLARLARIYMVRVNGKFYLSQIDRAAKELLDRHMIKLEASHADNRQTDPGIQGKDVRHQSVP